jgi:hypothetical protein
MNDDDEPTDAEKLKQISDELEEAFRKMPEYLRNRPRYYKLTPDKVAVPCSLYEFGLQFEHPEEYRRVGLTKIGPYVVSTVFLSIDHGWKSPQLFETMIWSEKTPESVFSEYQARYATWAEAVEGHALAVRLVETGLLP